jgi:hypothetical protein
MKLGDDENLEEGEDQEDTSVSELWSPKPSENGHHVKQPVAVEVAERAIEPSEEEADDSWNPYLRSSKKKAKKSKRYNVDAEEF